MRLKLVIYAGLAVITFIVFHQVAHFDFINFDDPDYVVQNPHVQKGLTLEEMNWALKTTYASNWHPLTWMSHMIDFGLFGLRPGMHHLTNVYFHVINGVLLLLLLQRMTGAFWRSAFAAGLFALHPLHVESVAWVSERKDVLSTMFWFLTTIAYVQYVRKKGKGWYWGSVVLFGLGLLAKPMLVTLPFVLVLLDIWPLGRIRLYKSPPEKSKKGRASPPSLHWPQLFREKLPFFALALGSSIVTVWAQHMGGAVATLENLPLAQRLGNAVIAYAGYIGQMFWPTKLAIIYPMGALDPWKVATGLLVLIVITVLVIRFGRTRPYLPVCWLWYLGTLVPVIGLIQVGQQVRADRYTYVSLVGLFVLISWLLWDLIQSWPRRRFLFGGAAGAALLVCTLLTWRQVGYWQNNITLNEHALRVTSDNYVAHNNLGIALFDQGKIAEAITHYCESLRIRPNYADAHNNLGVALAREGNLAQAAGQYEAALQLRPTYVEAHNNLGNVYLRQGKPGDAVVHHAEAIRLKPDDAEVRYNLGLGFWQQGRNAEAIQQFELALKLMPNLSQARVALTQLQNQAAKTNSTPQLK